MPTHGKPTGNATPDAKQVMRTTMRAQVRALSARARESHATAACAAIGRAAWFTSARTVLAFVSLPDELDTSSLLRAILAAGKRLAVPRVLVATGQLEAVTLTTLDDLIPGSFGVREPRGGTVIALSAIDVAIVPGVAFDRRGGRLGRGGGFYDRCLVTRAGLLTCGLAFATQVVERVPMQDGDQRVKWLATEAGVERCT